MRILLFLIACVAGLVLGLLGDEPLVGLALAGVIVYPVAVSFLIGGERDTRPREPGLLPACIAGVAGTLLVIFLIRLAFAAPGWVDPLSADCGGPSDGLQQLATWFAAIAFVFAAVPEAVTLAAIAGRLRGRGALANLPITLGVYPFAVALAGIALVVASYATSC